jgi:hypothetical protein
VKVPMAALQVAGVTGLMVSRASAPRLLFRDSFPHVSGSAGMCRKQFKKQLLDADGEREIGWPATVRAQVLP